MSARTLRFSIGPDAGFVGTVASICCKVVNDVPYVGLGFAEFPSGHFGASYFRKITPGSEVHGAEIERERFKQGNPWKERV